VSELQQKLVDVTREAKRAEGTLRRLQEKRIRPDAKADARKILRGESVSFFMVERELELKVLFMLNIILVLRHEIRVNLLIN
jgi:hypothetical protein